MQGSPEYNFLGVQNLYLSWTLQIFIVILGENQTLTTLPTKLLPMRTVILCKIMLCWLLVNHTVLKSCPAGQNSQNLNLMRQDLCYVEALLSVACKDWLWRNARFIIAERERLEETLWWSLLRRIDVCVVLAAEHQIWRSTQIINERLMKGLPTTISWYAVDWPVSWTSISWGNVAEFFLSRSISVCINSTLCSRRPLFLHLITLC